MTYNICNEVHITGECESGGKSDMLLSFETFPDDFERREKIALLFIEMQEMCNADRFCIFPGVYK